MRISNVLDVPIIDNTGKLHPQWRSLFSQLITQVQTNLSDEAYIMPNPDNTRINELNVQTRVGGMLYNDGTKAAMVNTEDNHTGQPTYSFKNLNTYQELTSAQVAAIPSGQRNGKIIYETDTTDTKLGVNDTFITL